MVRFVNDNQIPGLGLKQTLVASLVLDSKFLQGRSHLIVRSPEIRSFRIRVAGIDRDANVEHGPQPLIPLFNERRWADDEQPPYGSFGNQRPEHEPGLDGLPQPDVVSDQPAGRPRRQDPSADPQLMRQQRDTRGRENAPGVVYRFDGSCLCPRGHFDRGMPLRSEDLLKRSSYGIEFSLVTLLQPVVEANNRGVSFI